MGMNPEIKAQWVAALRSGEYQQGKGLLRRTREGAPDEFCCLGVLCDLAVRSGILPEPFLMDGAYFYGKGGDYVGSEACIPAMLSDRLSLNIGGLGTLPGGDDDLAKHNDSGSTFAEIADLIEQYL